MKRKYQTIKEAELLGRISLKLKPHFDKMTYREARSTGIGAAQIYQIRRGEPVDLHILTFVRVAAACGLEPADLLSS